MEYKISYVSKLVGLSEKRIREYEREGLVKPKRDKSSKHRLYGLFDIIRIKQVKALLSKRSLTLPGIKALLNLAPCWETFGCAEYADCAAYKHPNLRCYEARKLEDENFQCLAKCEVCPIYLTRNERIEPLFPHCIPE